MTWDGPLHLFLNHGLRDRQQFFFAQRTALIDGDPVFNAFFFVLPFQRFHPKSGGIGIAVRQNRLLHFRFGKDIVFRQPVGFDEQGSGQLGCLLTIVVILVKVMCSCGFNIMSLT